MRYHRLYLDYDRQLQRRLHRAIDLLFEAYEAVRQAFMRHWGRMIGAGWVDEATWAFHCGHCGHITSDCEMLVETCCCASYLAYREHRDA